MIFLRGYLSLIFNCNFLNPNKDTTTNLLICHVLAEVLENLFQRLATDVPCVVCKSIEATSELLYLLRWKFLDGCLDSFIWHCAFN